MPVFRLSDDPVFPPPEFAEDGLLAVGGDLSAKRLLAAYRQGIFPWYSEGEPILWWSPDPRMVLRPGWFHCSRSLRKTLRRGCFRFSFDRAFEQVLHHCAATPRPGQEGTWLTRDMRTAYAGLHRAGHAHSLEVWRDGKLAGGLYGLSLGGAFCGESMFSHESDASKAALFTLCRQCARWGIGLIDCQVPNPHLSRIGARPIPRAAFLCELERCVAMPSRCGIWTIDADLAYSEKSWNAEGFAGC